MKASVMKDAIQSAAGQIVVIEHKAIQLQHQLDTLTQRADFLRNIIQSIISDLDDASLQELFPTLFKIDSLLIEIDRARQRHIGIYKVPAKLQFFEPVPLR